MTVAGNNNLKQGPKAPVPGSAANAPRSADTKAFGRHASEQASKRTSSQALDK